jgi:hypothetical protein
MFMAKKKGVKTTPAAAAVGPTKKNGETVTAYFRKVFAKNPKLLDSRSNDELLKRWLDDHPEQTEVPKNIKANLANLKSVLRSKGRKKTAAKAAQDASRKARRADRRLSDLSPYPRP